MGRLLTIADKLFSAWGNIRITDENDAVAYAAKGEMAFFSPTWRLSKGHGQLATIRKKLLSWNPTWYIDGELGPFTIQRKRWSWTSRYQAIGGPFDGAEMNGDFWDLKFNIRHQGQDIARAKGKILSLRDKHYVEVLETDPKSELFIVVFMVVMQMDRLESRESSGD